jgi:uncharacterized spore protein YtfJ
VIGKDVIRLGDPVSSGDRVITPVMRVRYTLTGGAGFGSVEPVGLVVEEGGETVYYPFDPLRGWEWVASRLDA